MLIIENCLKSQFSIIVFLKDVFIMSDLLSRVRLHWNRSENLDVVKQVVQVKIHTSTDTRFVELELPYDQCVAEVVVKTPCQVEYRVGAINSSGELSYSEVFSRKVTRSIRPNPPTELTADITANDLTPDTRLSGEVIELVAKPVVQPVVNIKRVVANNGNV
jgi:hypothetical protein